MSKKLVAYFSASGVTAALAKKLAEAAEADIYEIKPKIPYTKPDLDWRDSDSRSSIEMKDLSSRPETADKDAAIGDYNIIFVGFPIWWYIAPTIINTFLESYDFSNKTVIPFATSGGSGFGRTMENLEPSAANSVIWKKGALLNGNQSKDALCAWIETLGL